MNTQSKRNYLKPPLLLAVPVLTLSLLQNAQGAADVPIDFFVDFQATADVQNGAGVLSSGATSSTTTGLDASILGGQRDMQCDAISGAVDNVNGNGECDPVGDICTKMSITGGKLSFSNDAPVVGTGIVQWDGADQDIALVKTGLGGIDLTHSGTSDRFVYTILNSDHGYNFTIEAYTDDTHYTIVNLPATEVTPGFPLTREIFFASLENPAFCGAPPPGVNSVECGSDGPVDFSNLGAFQLQFNVGPGDLTTAVDFQIGQITVPREDGPLGCRLTGGGVATDDTYGVPVWDGTLVDAESLVPEGVNRYQFGGQAGANTALPPQPKGEWQHHQQTGPAGSFSFHAGTASAPAGSEIIEIRCSDPGGCAPSGNPPSPNKQLDFDCIGTFHNIGKGNKAPQWLKAGANVTAEGNGNKTFDGTFHYCQVNVDDLGEGPDPAEGDSVACPPEGFGEKGVPTEPANCDCPDFYRITIYDGVDADTLDLFLPDGNIDQSKLNKTDIIYEVEGYLGRGGNGLQLHDLTGFDQK